MADFNKAFRVVMQFEGGYSNDPDDTGGETYRGISRRFHPEWGGWTIIDSYKQTHQLNSIDADDRLASLVKVFYKSQYWDKIHGDDIAGQPITECLFDMAVNMGIGQAVKFLQQSLNVYGNALAEDGKFGPATKQALDNCDAKKLEVVLKSINILRGYKYLTIVRSDPSQVKYLRGWLNRVTV